MIERWRELSTLVKTYLEPLPGLVDERSRLHTTFLQAVAATGRLSSVNPNLQNVPIRSALGREIRGCFVAGPGLRAARRRLLAGRAAGARADRRRARAQGDLPRAARTSTPRPPARCSRSSPSELDAGMRSKAKMINYGIVYGLTDFGLADRLQIPREEAAAFIATYFERFPAVREFIERTIEQAIEQGYVTTLLGRRRQIPELRARNRQQHALGERLAVNTVIQGTAADIIKVAMVRCDRAIAHAALAPDPADPRRAALRGAARGVGRAARDRRARDGRRVGARPAARRRRRRRAELARREVARIAAGQLDAAPTIGAGRLRVASPALGRGRDPQVASEDPAREAGPAHGAHRRLHRGGAHQAPGEVLRREHARVLAPVRRAEGGVAGERALARRCARRSPRAATRPARARSRTPGGCPRRSAAGSARRSRRRRTRRRPPRRAAGGGSSCPGSAPRPGPGRAPARPSGPSRGRAARTSRSRRASRPRPGSSSCSRRARRRGRATAPARARRRAGGPPARARGARPAAGSPGAPERTRRQPSASTTRRARTSPRSVATAPSGVIPVTVAVANSVGASRRAASRTARGSRRSRT